jgi:hypothetical protein
MDGNGGHYAKGNKLDTKRQVPHVLYAEAKNVNLKVD